MVIIRCNKKLPTLDMWETYEAFLAQAKNGVILLTPDFELLNEVPNDPDIVVIYPKEEV